MHVYIMYMYMYTGKHVLQYVYGYGWDPFVRPVNLPR